MVKVIDLFHESGTELAHFFNPVGIVSLMCGSPLQAAN
jgi:hypothetical protein